MLHKMQVYCHPKVSIPLAESKGIGYAVTRVTQWNGMSSPRSSPKMGREYGVYVSFILCRINMQKTLMMETTQQRMQAAKVIDKHEKEEIAQTRRRIMTWTRVTKLASGIVEARR